MNIAQFNCLTYVIQCMCDRSAKVNMRREFNLRELRGAYLYRINNEIKPANLVICLL